MDSLHFVSQAPEDSTKDEADSQGQKEASAIVLRHAPVDSHVLGEDGRELHRQRLGELVLELELLGALLRAAVLLQQTSIVPVWPHTTIQEVHTQSAAHMNWCTYEVVHMHLGENMAGASPVSCNYSLHVHCLDAKSMTACIMMGMQALQNNSRLLKALIHRNCWLAEMHTDISCWLILCHRSLAFVLAYCSVQLGSTCMPR